MLFDTRFITIFLKQMLVKCKVKSHVLAYFVEHFYNFISVLHSVPYKKKFEHFVCGFLFDERLFTKPITKEENNKSSTFPRN